MKNLLLSLVYATAFTPSYAQQYTTAIGVRGDWSNLDVAYSDFSLKHFINGSSNAFEATFVDPEFLSEANAIGLSTGSPRTGRQIQTLMSRIFATDQAILDRLIKIYSPN